MSFSVSFRHTGTVHVIILLLALLIKERTEMTPEVVTAPIWLQIVAVSASPAMFALVILVFNGRFSDINDRIADLRNQMQREHDNLAKKVDNLDGKVDTLLERSSKS